MGWCVDLGVISRITLLLFIGLVWGQLIDELETLGKYKERFLFQPENLYKSKGIWYSENSNEPFTGRLKIYSKNLNKYKVAECTIIDGLKYGFFIQYYDSREMLPGIMGLYINDKKDGNWTWIEPDKIYEKQSWDDSDLQILTSIDYRDGIKHGAIIVHKANLERFDYIQNYSYPRNDIILKGQYFNGERTGEWYYNDYIYSDFDWLTEPKYIRSMPFYWSRKQTYDKDNLIDSECREPWEMEIDCESYEQKYLEKIYLLPDRDETKMKTNDVKMKDIVVIKDNIGTDVEINIKEFIRHITKYHHSVVSIHKERGHYFTVNDNFRKMLNEKIGNDD